MVIHIVVFITSWRDLSLYMPPAQNASRQDLAIKKELLMRCFTVEIRRLFRSGTRPNRRSYVPAHHSKGPSRLQYLVECLTIQAAPERVNNCIG